MPRSSTLSQLANLTPGPVSPRSGRQGPPAGIPARPGPSLRHHRQTRRFLEGRCRATRTRREGTVTLGAKTKTLPLDFKRVLNGRGTHPSGSEPRQAIRPSQSCADQPVANGGSSHGERQSRSCLVQLEDSLAHCADVWVSTTAVCDQRLMKGNLTLSRENEPRRAK